MNIGLSNYYDITFLYKEKESSIYNNWVVELQCSYVWFILLLDNEHNFEKMNQIISLYETQFGVE